ncbi:unnamed protein product [Zymoseptoria tritici ST99CH_3D7]|uniref:alpha-glucosidase n=1 Tax=Zymoseptoria tritici (strain ST99CH_3D7) TaxID=1276538 RepID=A0A1X7S245_ZYMT9|nr:unnamed protein product [Zymoseptoria tritici ST99CH_3D7]
MRGSNGSWTMWSNLLFLLATICSIITPAVTVKHENFKTCDQSGFCKRNRLYADNALSTSTWESPYQLEPSTIKFNDGILTGIVNKKLASSETIRLPFKLAFYESGVARVTIDEEKRQKGEIELRHDSKARKERYNEAEKWAIVGGTTVSTTAAISKDADKDTTKVVYGAGSKFDAIIRHSPLSIDFRRDGEIQIKFNDKGLLNVEHWRRKVEKKAEEQNGTDDAAAKTEDKVAGEDESTWWDEAFGGNTDTKPRGPESVAMDISFPGYDFVYGIAEHAGPLALKETRGGDGKYSEPYRMYNADVFEYEMDSPMTLYGNIPFMQAQKKDSTVGVFWLNAAETWVDITKTSTLANAMSLGIAGDKTTNTHWISENGLLDVFVFLGPTPQDVLGAYTELTGTQQLPQHFSIASHQCRWNYVTDEDVRDVDKKFDKHRIPYDVIWLDIEYTDGKKYFTWDSMTFPDPLGMQKQLDEHDRKLVAIIDPHIKNEGGYPIVDELKSKGLAVNNKEGNIYEGWCWPGSSHWVDCFSPAARKWWADLFQYAKFPGSAKNLFIWNDMNEPSVFNGPETTMPKDNLHHDNWEHRDVHNLNGMTLINATYEGLLARSPAEQKQNVRPFVLTRSFFAGSQRLGAMWTGDNQAEWSHLAASIPMTLSMGISGFPFAGADVGGFFGNPDKELLTRWYQAGIFYPFMRAHAHIDTRRREPYLAGSPYTEIITQAIRLRYALLPAWYTAFHESHMTGAPIIRPHYYVFPGDEKGFAIDDQFFIGSTGLLAKPVTTPETTAQKIYLADKEVYYDYFDFWTYQGPGEVNVNAPLDVIPLLMRGGHIFPRRDRPRRSSGLMKYDPVTLVVVLGHSGDAEGTLYLDDGESFDYEQGAFIHRSFKYTAASKELVSEDLTPKEKKGKKQEAYKKVMKDVRVEKIVLVGVPDGWVGKTEVTVVEEGGKAERKVAVEVFAKEKEGKAAYAVVRDPEVRVGEGWRVKFE